MGQGMNSDITPTTLSVRNQPEVGSNRQKHPTLSEIATQGLAYGLDFFVVQVCTQTRMNESKAL